MVKGKWLAGIVGTMYRIKVFLNASLWMPPRGASFILQQDNYPKHCAKLHSEWNVIDEGKVCSKKVLFQAEIIVAVLIKVFNHLSPYLNWKNTIFLKNLPFSWVIPSFWCCVYVQTLNIRCSLHLTFETSVSRVGTSGPLDLKFETLFTCSNSRIESVPESTAWLNTSSARKIKPTQNQYEGRKGRSIHIKQLEIKG